LGNIWQKQKKAEFPGQREQEEKEQERKRDFRIAVLRDELTTRLFWLERAKEQGNQEEIELQKREIKNIIEELRELGVEVEEEEGEEKIAA